MLRFVYGLVGGGNEAENTTVAYDWANNLRNIHARRGLLKERVSDYDNSVLLASFL